jgi:hypothetical protein
VLLHHCHLRVIQQQPRAIGLTHVRSVVTTCVCFFGGGGEAAKAAVTAAVAAAAAVSQRKVEAAGSFNSSQVPLG